MVKTQYICDKCGDSQSTPEQFWTVGVGLTPFTSDSNMTSSPKYRENWCRACAEKTGFLIVTKPENTVETQPTIADLVREILARCQPD